MNKNLLIIIAGLLIGGIAGFAYWFFIGCNTGNCAITSNWTTSTLYGLGMGGLGGSIVKDSIAARRENRERAKSNESQDASISDNPKSN
ncbi:hypothetical protein CYPRO_2504 [Cyclonatronum proteinivorum]|uniref:Uncharacterized protein n=1 Tax=Cyclonatronum proteinivorum TaxID=1457365 RepID=A0A345UMP4_9BACT|nr:hypothetical protein [Cyclonatronum proteinivorum]AXJ01746.1 hypothetical protein CYPRO_2504 [Cyclonatronum proteinivorum]